MRRKRAPPTGMPRQAHLGAEARALSNAVVLQDKTPSGSEWPAPQWRHTPPQRLASNCKCGLCGGVPVQRVGRRLLSQSVHAHAPVLASNSAAAKHAQAAAAKRGAHEWCTPTGGDGNTARNTSLDARVFACFVLSPNSHHQQHTLQEFQEAQAAGKGKNGPGEGPLIPHLNARQVQEGKEGTRAGQGRGVVGCVAVQPVCMLGWRLAKDHAKHQKHLYGGILIGEHTSQRSRPGHTHWFMHEPEEQVRAYSFVHAQAKEVGQDIFAGVSTSQRGRPGDALNESMSQRSRPGPKSESQPHQVHTTL
eukprot:362342-Chlamydomonas_euryale.AAC.9